MKDNIYILCSTDDKYVPWCGIMLTSLFESNLGEHFVVFLLESGLNEKNISSFKLLAERYGAEIRFVPINIDLLDGVTIREGDTVSLATFYRLLAPRFLPENLKKVIYLDCDIIIDGAIRPLWETPIDGFALGAVIDESFYKDELYQRLNYPKDASYVNAGVELLNLQYWRENRCVERCIECVHANQDILTLYDQDAINKVLHREIKHIHPTWNFQHGFLLSWQYGYYTGELKQQIDNCTHNPVIIHFDGRSKPWHKDSQHPYTSYFLYFKDRSLWKDTPLIGSFPLSERFKWARHYLVGWLGLRPTVFRIKKAKK